MEYVTLNRKYLLMLRKLLLMRKEKCHYCKTNVIRKQLKFGIMPHHKLKAVLICGSPLCMVSYFEYEEQEIQKLKKVVGQISLLKKRNKSEWPGNEKTTPNHLQKKGNGSERIG